MASNPPKAFVFRSFDPVPGTTGPAIEVFSLLTDQPSAKELGSFLSPEAAGRAAAHYDKFRKRPPLTPTTHLPSVTYAGTSAKPVKVEWMQVDDERMAKVTECSLDELPANEAAQVLQALQRAETQDLAANIGASVESSTAGLPRTSLPSNIEVVSRPEIRRPGWGRR